MIRLILIHIHRYSTGMSVILFLLLAIKLAKFIAFCLKNYLCFNLFGS
jgi:hypothetical protein